MEVFGWLIGDGFCGRGDFDVVVFVLLLIRWYVGCLYMEVFDWMIFFGIVDYDWEKWIYVYKKKFFILGDWGDIVFFSINNIFFKIFMIRFIMVDFEVCFCVIMVVLGWDMLVWGLM